MAYTLTSSSASVNEDSTVRITVYTTGLSNGTLVPYSISGTGINSADFVGSPLLTGNFVINSNQATITLNPLGILSLDVYCAILVFIIGL